MKRTAILTLTAFYLLLTSGRFVCAVHCGVEKLVAKPGMQMACEKSCCKQQRNCKNNDCSKTHGSFVIKENLKPVTEVQFVQNSVSVLPIQRPKFLLTDISGYHPLFETGKAPPGISGKLIFIKLHSLLI